MTVHQITVFHYYSSSVSIIPLYIPFLLYLNIENVNHSAIRLTSHTEHIFFPEVLWTSKKYIYIALLSFLYFIYVIKEYDLLIFASFSDQLFH